MAANEESDKIQNLSEALYALAGIKMWLNNQPLEAENYFRKRKSIQIEAGLTFLSFLVSEF